jgi:hypothetical protein
MYVTLVPGLVAGVLNMVWCKVGLAKRLTRPIDAGRRLKDGERVFGDNKTWKGLVGMVGLAAAVAVVWGLVCAGVPSLEAHMLFYRRLPNTVLANVGIGAAIGMAYAVFELPNSFLKRRAKIRPGTRAGSGWRVGFAVLDQIDSVIGMVLVVTLVYPLGLGFFCLYVLVGGLTHAVVNLGLYAARLRKNPL